MSALEAISVVKCSEQYFRKGPVAEIVLWPVEGPDKEGRFQIDRFNMASNDAE